MVRITDSTTLDLGVSQAEEYILRGPRHRNDTVNADQTQGSFEFRLKALRRRLGLSQAAFAARYGLPLGTVRNWEQGRRARSDAAGDLLLSLIERDPEGAAKLVQHQGDLEHSD